jgi:hypothetical protein
MADAWATRRGKYGHAVRNEPHPADWKEHGDAAGPIRNAEMVDDSRGYNECLAFVMLCAKPGLCYRHGKPWPKPHITHGTADCIDRAEAHGIHVKEFTG